jgi:predicted membrane protein
MIRQPTMSQGNSALSTGMFWMLTALSLWGALLSPNALPFAFGMAVFLFFLTRFYNSETPPVLLYCFIFEWLFFQTQLFDGLAKGIDLTVLDFSSPTKPFITILGLIAVFSFFLGVFLIVRKLPKVNFAIFKNYFLHVSLEKILFIYLLVYVTLLFVGGLIWAFPSLTQPLYVLLEFRWSLFFFLFVGSFVQNKYKWLVFLIILVEASISLFSFFSTFKEIFIFSFLGYWIFFFRSSVLNRFVGISMLMAVLYFGVLWTSIKKDYRSFLNKGTGAQAVLVSRSEAYFELTQLVTSVKNEDLQNSFDVFVDRLSWIGALDAVYNYVPRVRKHQDGNLWFEAIKRTVMPRLFFPDKKPLTDSKELNYYSGLGVDEKDTSISLSVICASYIDFGVWGMHVPLFLLGLLFGWIYTKAFRWGGNGPVGFAFLMPLVYTMQISGQSINKLLPHIVLYLLVLWTIQMFLLKPFLRYIKK